MVLSRRLEVKVIGNDGERAEDLALGWQRLIKAHSDVVPLGLWDDVVVCTRVGVLRVGQVGTGFMKVDSAATQEVIRVRHNEALVTVPDVHDDGWCVIHVTQVIEDFEGLEVNWV